MKKNFFIVALFGLIFLSCNDKNKSANDAESKTSNEAVKDTLTDADRLEGKVVMSSAGEWFVIKEGLRWRAMSEPATTDYLNSIANGQNNVVRDVPETTLSQFPIAGEILPKLEFKKN